MPEVSGTKPGSNLDDNEPMRDRGIEIYVEDTYVRRWLCERGYKRVMRDGIVDGIDGGTAAASWLHCLFQQVHAKHFMFDCIQNFRYRTMCFALDFSACKCGSLSSDVCT